MKGYTPVSKAAKTKQYNLFYQLIRGAFTFCGKLHCPSQLQNAQVWSKQAIATQKP